MKKHTFKLSKAIITLIVIGALLLIGRGLKIVSPIAVWAPSVCMLFAQDGSPASDSVYITCLQKKIDILSEKSGYRKREIKQREKLLQFYLNKRDTSSVDYALAKASYLTEIHKMDYCAEIGDAKEILWDAWQQDKLDDNDKILLCSAMTTMIKEGEVRNSKEVFKDMLKVAETISDEKIRLEWRQICLFTLLKITLEDMQQWPEAQLYYENLQPQFCQLDYMRQFSWIAMSQYQLQLHNTKVAQEYLDSAMQIKTNDKALQVEMSRQQTEIYKANGEWKNTIAERKKQAALLYQHNWAIKMYKQFLRYESAIEEQSLWKIKWYSIVLNAKIQTLFEKAYEQKDSLDQRGKYALIRWRNMFYVLAAKAVLETDRSGNGVIQFIQEIKEFDALTSEEFLQLIDLSIRAATLYPSDSVGVVLQQNIEELQARLKVTFPYMTDGEKAIFWNKEEPILRNIYSVDSCSDVKYNATLLTKGLLLNSSNRVKRAILESGDSALVADWRHLQMLRSSYNYSKYSADEIANMQMLADSLEHSIVRRSNEYQQEISTWDITWQDVQNQLKSDECAIEFIHYPINNNGIKDNQYTALLLTKNEAPREIELFKESEFPIGDTILYRSEVKLYQYIWEPLVPYLSNGNIYISVDGLLHHINIEAMPLENGKLLSEIYNVIRVSSTRELVQSGNVSWVHTTLYGGIKYDLTKQEIQSNAITDTKYKENVSRGYIFRTNKEEKIMQFNMLKYSLQEVQQIDAVIKDYEYTTSLYTNDNASEETFKSLSGKRNSILHIATHGIFDRKSDDYIDPMRRSSLLLAGANNSFRNRGKNNTQEGQDGILTASEISALDLRGTELVVLSACNTAKGDITPDGVFGLQRAFKHAGAQTIIMTLWNINDESTAVFMENLYKALLQGKTKREAFNSTMKLQKERYPDPLHWAGFIMLD